MSQAANIRAGMVTALAPLLKSNGGPLGQILPYVVSNVQAPCAYVDTGPIVYDLAMHRGVDEAAYKVVALMPVTETTDSQKQIDILRDGTGALSVKTLLEADRTLGGVCQTLKVTQLTESRLYTRQQGGTVLGCEWQISVYP